MELKNVGPLLAVCLVATSASSSESQAESRERFVCISGGTQRLIDIYRLAPRGAGPGGCRVDYTKEGVTRQLWSANVDYAYCVRQAVALVTKLSKDNFSCKPQSVDQPQPVDRQPPGDQQQSTDQQRVD
jgi:hypothetical protein